jgi:hypothetical protein
MYGRQFEELQPGLAPKLKPFLVAIATLVLFHQK